jgi:hypothetical protein
MLGPPRYRSKGCIGTGPSTGWIVYWMAVLYAGIVGYEVFQTWFYPVLPPLFQQVTVMQMAVSLAAAASGVVIAGVVVGGGGYLIDRFTAEDSATSQADNSRAATTNSATTNTTVQSSQETESS